MPKFLLDANISPLTTAYLKTLGYKVRRVNYFNLSNANDEEIFELAQKKKLTIITLDLDFGQIYYFSSHARAGVIILKLGDQTIESVNRALLRLHKTKVLEKSKFQKSLIVVDEKRIRIRTKI